MDYFILGIVFANACLVSASHRNFFHDKTAESFTESITWNQKNQPRVDKECNGQTNVVLPPTATDTTQRLVDLRKEMAAKNYSAYIVPYSDAHLSEYIAPSEKRRTWISGFSGSSGTAVITLTSAALWTDGRYFIQGEQQLDCNWILMKTGEVGVPSMEEWLTQELETGDLVAASPFLFSIEFWQNLEVDLATNQILLTQSIPDLIDLIWIDRPLPLGTSIMVFPDQYAGKSWTEKLNDARVEMENNHVEYLLLSILDEIAWFFNLRGNDIPYTPVFTSYAIVSKSSDVLLFADTDLLDTTEINSHLNESGCAEKLTCVQVLPYDSARPTLVSLAQGSSSKFWLAADGTNYGMYSAVDPSLQFSEYSPLKVAKATKNPTEVNAMRQAHLYDAVALCEYIQWLEVNVPLGKVDELIGEDYLKNLRLDQAASQGLSFGSISASGPNGAIIHYGSTEETNRNLTTDEIYLIDSGGQYLEGTTDVTRTMHFGTPTDYEKEAFTRALMGVIDLESAIFPYTKNGNDLDILARRHLYNVGLEYRHGTGHGVGQYLCIHEYPPGIGNAAGGEFPLQIGMITSIGCIIWPDKYIVTGPASCKNHRHFCNMWFDIYFIPPIFTEPGYYEENAFGIRHENLNVVVMADTPYQFGGYEFYTFDPLTLVPFQKKMVDTSLLSDSQLKYFNEYHAVVLRKVGDEAVKQNKPDLKAWLEQATSPLERNRSTANQSSSIVITSSVLLCLIMSK